ncbi:MAG: rRNA maturation RNase YbeY [Zoogloeaceae bacterium]|jgi:probable rRNA maturation factor|nr:rRNA maturation RNase YbeY [Zoogloeaceae bacterium]
MNRRRTFVLHVQYAIRDRTGLPAAAQFRRWASAALPKEVCGEVTLRLVSAEEIRMLNRDFRKKDTPTNVLSFSYETHPQLLGDLAICPKVVAREAAEQKKTLAAHYAHLTLHGMLHLQGFDHETPEEAEQMEARERTLLIDMGFPDPYFSPE